MKGIDKMELKEYCGIMNLSKCLINGMNEAKAQEQKHIDNKKCKEPSFATCKHYLNRLAEREGLPPLTDKQVEEVVRMYW